jgi:hypothetical protein
MVGSQNANLTSSPSFGYNLCLKCPNGSCKLILDIYVPRAFQWYKEFFNPISFDPYNCPLKIWESIKTPTPKVGTHLGVWGFIPSTFLHSHEHEMWFLGSLLACTFANPCLGREPKVKVATSRVCDVKWMNKWLNNQPQLCLLSPNKTECELWMLRKWNHHPK